MTVNLRIYGCDFDPSVVIDTAEASNEREQRVSVFNSDTSVWHNNFFSFFCVRSKYLSVI